MTPALHKLALRELQDVLKPAWVLTDSGHRHFRCGPRGVSAKSPAIGGARDTRAGLPWTAKWGVRSRREPAGSNALDGPDALRIEAASDARDAAVKAQDGFENLVEVGIGLSLHAVHAPVNLVGHYDHGRQHAHQGGDAADCLPVQKSSRFNAPG